MRQVTTRHVGCEWLVEIDGVQHGPPQPSATAASKVANALRAQKPGRAVDPSAAEPDPEVPSPKKPALDMQVIAEGVGQFDTEMDTNARVCALLVGTVDQIRAALEAGTADDVLDEAEAAEAAGKNRKGVLAAIAGRRG